MKYSTTARNGKEDKKEEILKVATKLFTVQGYSKTGMRQIAKEANVSLALITYYFSTKELWLLHRGSYTLRAPELQINAFPPCHLVFNTI